MTKRHAEKLLEESSPEMVWVKLNYAEYNHVEDDTQRHEGDVIKVEAGRAAALIERGHATKADAPKPKRKRNKK